MSSEGIKNNAGAFPQTRWSLVVQDTASTTPAAQSALGELLQDYWQPLYAYARQMGLSPEDAADAVQSLYESLIARSSLRSVNQKLGRLRSFLLSSLQNHIRSKHRKETRQKRGGGTALLMLDAHKAQCEKGLIDGERPDLAFERRWALTLLARVLDRLRADYVRRGRERLFEKLEPQLSWQGTEQKQEEIAAELGMSKAAFAQAVKRMRTRYRVLLEAEIGQTVEGEQEVAEERAYLIRMLSQG